MKTHSIRTKTLFISLLPLTLMTLILSAIYIMQRANDIDSNVSASLTNNAEIIANNSELEVIAQNQLALFRLINSHVNNDNILSILITDKSGNQLAFVRNPQYQENTDNAGITHDKDLVTIKKPIIPIPIDVQAIPASSAAPDKTETAPVGYVIITGTTKHAQKLKFSSFTHGLILSIIAMLLTAIMAYFLSRNLSKPLETIVDTVKNLSGGNLQIRNPEDSSGEIGMLQKNINTMAASLEYARELDKKRSEDLLYNEKSRAMTTLESLGEGVITTDQHGFISYINPTASRLTGYNTEDAIGQHLHQIFRTSNTATYKEFDYPIQSCIDFGAIIRHDALLRLTNRNGDDIVIRDTSTAIYDKNNNAIGAVLIFDDFTSMHNMAERLVYQASHDDLTGLANRREFETQLENSLHEVHSGEAEHVLCYIDLDQFKIINDTCGHAAGDELLRQLSQLIKGKVRGHDILARLGGDEFGIILKNCPTDRAVVIANNILTTLASFIFSWGTKQHQVGASVGLVALNKTQLSLSDAMIAADSACYIAKEQGRNRVHIFTPTDTEIFKLHGAMQWFQRIKDALSQETLELYVQQIHPISQNALTENSHYEVLLRLRSDGTIYSPDAFITTAERYNLMPNLDRWVVLQTFTVLRQFHSSPDGAASTPYLSINLSGQSIGHEDFHAFVYDALLQSQIDPGHIIFEITETAAIANLNHAIHFMNKFRDMGCRFALDDFGSGLSSFGYLTSLPVDFIKIDGKLIRSAHNNPINFSIVDAINRIAHEMKLATIAEYVEDDAILEQMRALGIDYVQGFSMSSTQPIQTLQINKN